MVFLQRSNASHNPRKRPSAAAAAASPIPRPSPSDDPQVDVMISLLAEAGCTLRVPRGAPPAVDSSDDPHRIRRHLERRFASDPAALVPAFLDGFGSYIRSKSDLHRVLIPMSYGNQSLARILLSVPLIQPQIQQMLLEKLPEHFTNSPTQDSLPLKDDIARLIINQFRWLDFLVEPSGFADKLMEMLSVAPERMKREIVGLVPEIVGDQSHSMVLPALEKLLSEDSELVVPVLDALSDLNFDEQLQEQAITIAISCLRTVDPEHMPHLLRFLLLSANQANARRIISQIRDHLKFTGPSDVSLLRNKKLKGKCTINITDGAILDTLRSNIRFKNILCEAILRELKSIEKPQHHKIIDVWFIILIYSKGGTLQKSVEKMLKKKVVQEYLVEALFDQCIRTQRELVKDHFSSFLSVTEYLLSCKEDKARDFAIHLFTALFEEFGDIYSRQELLGILVTHIGSGISHEVCSALDMLLLLTSKQSEELVPISSHINGIMDFLEGFNENNLRKVYEIFCNLALHGRSKDPGTSSIGNELLMIVRKQMNNPDKKYRKMGIIGTLRVVCSLGDIRSPGNVSLSQKSSFEEALELLQMAINSCKTDMLSLILLYDELSALLEKNNLQPIILDWVGVHAGQFESQFLADLEEGQLTAKHISDGIEGELWMNLDGDLSPVCINILPIVASSLEQNSSTLQLLPSQFTLLSVVERLTNQGSLAGIDALLGCPMHLPAPKLLNGGNWRKLSGKQRKLVGLSFYYAVNWIRELLNAFSTQVGMVDVTSQKTNNETMAKLLKRLRNLILLEGLLDRIFQSDSFSLPEISHSSINFNSAITSKPLNTYPRKRGRKCNTENNKEKEVSDMPNPDGKNMKQTTILDAYKKAGVSVSQELLISGSLQCAAELSNPCSGEFEADVIESIDLSMVSVQLNLQRGYFRPLLAGALSILTFSESQTSCCPDPEAELPLHLYLLRNLNSKLEKINSELLVTIQPLFGSFRRHFDNAFSLVSDGYENCPDHWQSSSSSSGNPDIPHVVVPRLSIASSLVREVLRCYRKMLSSPDIFFRANLPILRDMLEALKLTEDVGSKFSEIKSSLLPGNLDYLYGGMYIFLETIIDEACSLSYLLASDIIETMQSVISSFSTLMEKQFEIGKSINTECSQKLLPSLRKRLGESAHKLLTYDLSSCKDGGDTLQNKDDIIQKILRIYLQNSESTSDLLDQLAGSVLPQVPSCKTMESQEMHHEFQTLSPNMFLTWYRSLHEENHGALAKLVKEVIPKSKANSNRDAIKGLLEEMHKLVNVLVSLVKMCRMHDKVAVHAMAVKYGGRFVDTFLKAFGFLKSHFEENSVKIIEMVKEIQKATRLIQTICSEAKRSKRTMITTKIPATKKSLERLLYEVKALLHNTTGGTFEIGVLKHKDLSGQVVSSQVYDYGDDCNDDDDDDDGHGANAGSPDLDAIVEEDGMDVDQDANDSNSNREEDTEARID